MTKIVEDLKEKKWQFWSRMALRFLCGGILIMYAVFRIGVPLVEKERLYLDENDGYVIIGSIAIYLAVEAVRGLVLAFAKSKMGNDSNS